MEARDRGRAGGFILLMLVVAVLANGTWANTRPISCASCRSVNYDGDGWRWAVLAVALLIAAGLVVALAKERPILPGPVTLAATVPLVALAIVASIVAYDDASHAASLRAGAEVAAQGTQGVFCILVAALALLWSGVATFRVPKSERPQRRPRLGASDRR